MTTFKNARIVEAGDLPPDIHDSLNEWYEATNGSYHEFNFDDSYMPFALRCRITNWLNDRGMYESDNYIILFHFWW